MARGGKEVAVGRDGLDRKGLATFFQALAAQAGEEDVNPREVDAKVVAPQAVGDLTFADLGVAADLDQT